MKVVIVNCFDTYEERIDLIYNFFIKKGHEVTVIQSNFRHFKKEYRTEWKKNFIFVETKTYYKNMSIDRLKSHYRFASDAFRIVNEIEPDLLYVTVPPNSLSKFAADYKRKNKRVILIYDLIDLWPETLPVGKIKNLPPFTFWKGMRDNNFKMADVVITECELYQLILKKVFEKAKVYTKTVYLAKSDIRVNYNPIYNNDEIHLCYLGSINNIIDITKIKLIIKNINKIKPTTLHIIGDGESKDILINEVEETGAKIEYYGKVYDAQEKQKIFDRCHLGINIMKESVCVGLTMKSIDYFQHRLPIINNIKADTTQIVDQYKIGFNISDFNINDLAYEITKTNTDEFMEMRKNTQKAFNELFSQTAFEENFNLLIKELIPL